MFTSSLGTAKSRLGLTRFATEYDPLEVFAINGLALVSEGRSTTIPGSATSSLVVTQTASAVAAVAQTALSTIVLTQVAGFTGVEEESNTSTLVLAHTAVSHLGRVYTANSALTLTSTAIGLGNRVSASSALALTSSARKAETYTVAGSSALTLTSTAVGTGERVDASSTITLSDAADANGTKLRAVTHTLTLTDTVVESVSKLVKSTLSLTDIATVFKTLAEVVQPITLTQEAHALVSPSKAISTIELVQTARSSIQNVRAESVIALTSDFHVSVPVRVSATSEITMVTEVFDPETVTITEVESGLSQSVVIVANVTHPASSHLSFSSVANGYNLPSDAIPATATSALTLTQVAAQALGGDLTSTLALAQTATGQVAKTIPASTLVLESEAEAHISRANVPATTAISLQQAATFVLESSDVLCDYTPFVGASTDPNAPTPPSATYDAAVNPVAYRLRWTDGMTTDDVALPRPSLGNKDRITGQRFNNETRGGYLVVHGERDAPRVETLVLTFTRLKPAEVTALRNFMLNHLGKLITYVDHEDRHWSGVIVQPGDSFVEDRRGSFTASFEFQGSLV